MSLIDPAMEVLGFALDGIASRQRMIAQNIANAETPGYTAIDVNFEDSLRDALARGSADTARVTTESSTGEAGINGNNVQLDEENIELLDANLTFQMMTEAMNAKFLILRSSMRRD